MPEALRLVDPFPKQQVDVVEEKLAPLAERHSPSGAPRRQIRCLRQDPGISQHTAADEYAADAAAKPVDDVLRLDAVAAAKHRNDEVVCDVGHQVPIR